MARGSNGAIGLPIGCISIAVRCISSKAKASCSPPSRRNASNALAMIGNGFPVVAFDAVVLPFAAAHRLIEVDNVGIIIGHALNSRCLEQILQPGPLFFGKVNCRPI